MADNRNPVAAVTALAAVLAMLIPSVATAKPAKPVATTLFLHGNESLGETESFSLVAEGMLPMDTKKPTGSDVRSKMITNYVVGPNTGCAGNNLFPAWSGEVSGRIKGDVKLTFHTIGTPGPVEVRIWPDVLSSLCNSETTGAADYPEPAGAVTVELPPGSGTVEAVMKGVDFHAVATLLVQVSPVVAVDLPSPAGALLTPFVSRMLYDTPDLASSLQFTCVPAKGKSSCTP